MVAGHLQEKKGYFYMVLSYPDAAGKRKTKWLPTGLPVKGNKKKAEKMLMETRQTFVPECKPRKICCFRIFCFNGWKSQSRPSHLPHTHRTQVWQRALSFRISRKEKSHFPK